MEMPNWSCHTQSIERVVTMATEASSTKCILLSEGWTQETSRRLMSKAESKQDLFNLAKFRN